MASQFEEALRELELSTETLLSTDESDLAALCNALERRADAITRIASRIGNCGHDGLDRLKAALIRGDEATRKILRMKQDAIAEWTRFHQLARGFEGARSERRHEVDCSG